MILSRMLGFGEGMAFMDQVCLVEAGCYSTIDTTQTFEPSFARLGK